MAQCLQHDYSQWVNNSFKGIRHTSTMAFTIYLIKNRVNANKKNQRMRVSAMDAKRKRMNPTKFDSLIQCWVQKFSGRHQTKNKLLRFLKSNNNNGVERRGGRRASVQCVSFKWPHAQGCILQLMIIASSQGINPHVQHNSEL